MKGPPYQYTHIYTHIYRYCVVIYHGSGRVTLPFSLLPVHICKPLWLHHEEKMARLGVRLFNGECEISNDEAAEIRKIIEPWSWVARDAIEKQLTKK